ncbi:MAG: NAD(P)H-hydrate dehydratase [Gemmatimonadales bacterium]
MSALPVVSAEQATAWDRLTIESGLPAVALMENAGRATAAVLTARFGPAMGRGTLIAVGPGNNGGDGWVIARTLHQLGWPVWVVPVTGNRSPLNQLQAQLAETASVRKLEPDGPWPAVGLVIDALLGTGASDRPRAPMASLLVRLAELELPVAAIDGPTGLDLNTGVSRDALQAELTLTFGGYRRGHLLARDEVGDVVVLEIGFVPPPAAWPTVLRERDAVKAAVRLAAASHKGTRGRIVVIGGDVGMTGAARLAARAAFAAGAGLVHVAAPAESLAVLAAAEPDLQTVATGFDRPSDALAELASRADALVIGPGLGRRADRADFVRALAAIGGAPLVIDADALMAFQGDPSGLASAIAGRTAVLTPHAGEFRALFPALASALGVDPWGAASEAAATLGATVLLKGVPTVVAGPNHAPITVVAGNPGLATGGSGDTLSGVIGAWLAQRGEPALAAAAAAHAMGEAADIAARRLTARSVRPMDVIAALPDVWRRWDQVRREAPTALAPILHTLAAPIGV